MRRLAATLAGNGGGGAPTPNSLGATLHLPCDSVLRNFSGAVLVLDDHGRVLSSNESAAPLAKAMHGRGGDGGLSALIDEALTRGPSCGSVTVGDDKTFDISVVSLVGDGLLVIGRETSFEHNLREALTDSRQRYKDFVECSSDFAWETDANGAFFFVSPRGALGYSAADLVGGQPEDFLHSRHDAPPPLPFHCTEPMEDVLVWMRDAGGNPACLKTSCFPVIDRHGQRTGARGVCTDITEARERDEALARANRRERLVGGLVTTIREEVDPEQLLNRAAEATARTLGGTIGWISRTRDDGALAVVATFDSNGGDALPLSLTSNLHRLVGGPGTLEAIQDGYTVIASAARHRDDVNGAVFVARDAEYGAWENDDHALLAAVAGHLGIAIEQIANHETLKRLSSTDELTGLLNRRAFTAAIGRRHVQAQRTGRAASLLYVDLDNFKLVNDTYGHERGDAALVEWAEAMTPRTRAGDVVARLGGDEFAIWLEETDRDGAIAKAQELLAESARLASYTGDPERPLCASIGVAVFEPASGESLNDLLARADTAMYSAKHGGKGTYAVAPPFGSDSEPAQAQ